MSDQPTGENSVSLVPVSAQADEDAEQSNTVSKREFVKFEKNLSAMGFFSAANTGQPRPKTVAVTRNEDGKRLKTSITISPSMPWGLPTVAHQDKTFAFFKILQERQEAGENIENPVRFHSAELLHKLGLDANAGKNYREVYQWLDVMTFTGIKSEASLYLAGRKHYGTDRFHVFARSVSHGRPLSDGATADRNYVWLSDWMLENLRSGYLVTVDFDAYKRLRNPIAKVLVPLLQVWFYASEEQGEFTKRYAEFCQQVGITEYRHLSKILEKLTPALDELQGHGYLAFWQVAEGSEGYNLTLRPGSKYFEASAAKRGLKPGTRKIARSLVQKPRRLPPSPALPSAAAEPAPVPPAAPIPDPELVQELIRCEIAEDVARQLAAQKPDECRQQLAYLAFRKVKGSRAGFLRRAIEAPGGYSAPEGYEEHLRRQSQADSENASKTAQNARRGAVVQELVQLAETLVNGDAEAISGFLAFFKSERARALRKFPQGGRVYQAVADAYEGEQKQLELLVAYYAQRPCPLAAMNAFIAQHTAIRLQKCIKAYFVVASEKSS